MNWIGDEEELYDVLARDIIPEVGSDVIDVVPGEKCRARFSGSVYDIKVIACGKMHCKFMSCTSLSLILVIGVYYAPSNLFEYKKEAVKFSFPL